MDIRLTGAVLFRTIDFPETSVSFCVSSVCSSTASLASKIVGKTKTAIVKTRISALIFPYWVKKDISNIPPGCRV
jgi:hypothetical protein